MEYISNEELCKLIRDVANGDMNALSEIYLKTGKSLSSVARIYLKRKQDVEDALQDMMITVVKNAKKFSYDKNAFAWLVQIMRNSLRNKLRHDKIIKMEPLEDYIAATEDNIDAKIEVYEIMRKLTNYEQDLIIYKYWSGMSLAEIGAVLHKPKTTIQYQLKILEEKIRKFYSDRTNEDL